MFFTQIKVAYLWTKETLIRWNQMTTVLFQKTK